MTALDPAAQPESRPRRGRMFWLKVAAIVLTCVLVIAMILLAILYRMSTSRPEFWDQNQDFLAQSTPIDLKRIADHFQRKTLADISSPGTSAESNPSGAALGTGQTTRMVIPLRDVNAWLDADLPAWLAHKGIQLPPHIGRFMLATQNSERVLLAFESDQPMMKQVITATLRIEIQADGKAFVQLESIRAGSLPIPNSAILLAIPQAANSRVQANAESVRNLIAGQSLDPILHIDRSRQARVTAIELGQDQIVVTFKTEKRE